MGNNSYLCNSKCEIMKKPFLLFFLFLVSFPRTIIAQEVGEDSLYIASVPSFSSPYQQPRFVPQKLSPLSLSLDMGLTVGWGKHNPWRGAAFHTTLSGAYNYQVNDRLTLAAGGYLNHFSGWGTAGTTMGIYALANYQFNERLDGTVFLTHDFGLLDGKQRFMGPPVPGLASPATTLGADFGIRLGNHSKVNLGISVTRSEYPLPYIPGRGW